MAKWLHQRVTTDHKWIQLGDQEIATYCCFDTVSTAALAPTLVEALKASRQWDFYQREVAPVIPALLAMARRGVPIDQAERTRLRRSFRAEVRACDEVLFKAAGYPYQDPYGPTPKGAQFNPNSDTQIRRWLFGGDRTVEPPDTRVMVAKPKLKADGDGVFVSCLGLRPAGKTEGKMWSVDLTNLVRVVRDLRVMDEPHREVLYALTHRARYVKLDEYLDFPVEEDSRVRPTWKLHGTKSLRLAVSDPALHSWAEELRSMVRARPGYVFVRADFAAVEARMAAYLSGDRLDIETYERPGTPPYKHHPAWDIHSQMVLECFPELSEPEWEAMGKDREPYRNTAKTIRFGTLLYGGEPETAQTKVFCPCPKCAGKTPPTINLTPARKRQIVDRWMATHRQFVQWREKLVEPFRGPHATYTLRMPVSGWPVRFYMPWGPELMREVYNRPIQHAANILKLRAMVRLHARGVPLVIDHHDALYAEVPEGQARETEATMVECMAAPVPELGGVVFPVDTAVGYTWGSLH